MKNKLAIGIAIAVIVILALYSSAYQVRYDQVAVETLFANAVEPTEKGQLTENSGSVIVKPGLYFKWPAPFGDVKYYTTRLQVLDDVQEEQLTSDGFSIIVKTYAVWHISDPYAFYRTLKDEGQARAKIEQIVRTTRGVVSKYSFDQLVNTDASKIKLKELEDDFLAAVRLQLDPATNGQVEIGADGKPGPTKPGPNYGITIDHFGLRRLVLPAKVTDAVFVRMQETRKTLAEHTRSAGLAQAGRIKSDAESTRKTILSFAELRAQKIRAEGDRKAAGAYTAFVADPEFAVFLRQMEALKKMLATNTTFVLDANDLSPLGLFSPAQNKK